MFYSRKLMRMPWMRYEIRVSKEEERNISVV
jgi:hypothetical protein